MKSLNHEATDNKTTKTWVPPGPKKALVYSLKLEYITVQVTVDDA